MEMETENQNIIIEKEGLEISRYFTKEGVNPFDMYTYEKRCSTIKNSDGSKVFEMNDVEVPNNWSQVATDILAQKYFRKAGVPLKNESGELLLDESGKVITGSETSIKQVAHRLAGCWRHWGEKFGYFTSENDAQIFYEEMAYMVTGQYAAPNSPQWFTTGLNWSYGLTGPAQGHSYIDPITKKLEFSKDAYTRSQPHACFIQSVSDDLVRGDGIFSLLTREARVFKYGSGTGSNFSQVRGKGERLTGGGTSSGLMSFLKIFDVAAGSIKSGGTTRRAAKMVCLDLDHPEIKDFIWWKVREEEKVAGLVTGSKILKRKLSKLIEAAKGKENPLDNEEVRKHLQAAYTHQIPLNYMMRALDLAKQGYDLPLQEFDTHYESEAYRTVSGQNSNNSVRIPNKFFHALDNNSEWELKARTDGSVMETMPAQELWDEIGYCAWASADPGVQYDTLINEWHTCPNDGRINGSNPCSEYMFLDDTACNLASINLIKFYDEEKGEFDILGYRHAIRLWSIVLEISVLMAHFPSEKIAKRSFEYRTIGLGFANLGTLLMLEGIPYDSEKGRTIAGAIAAIMTGDSYSTSAELAKVLGPFERYENNKEDMLKVISNHRSAAYNNDNYKGLSIKPQAIDQNLCPGNLLQAAHNAWDNALEKGEKYGYRNAQTTVIAPTGTIGLVMDCDTTGVEPDYALVKYKKLAGGGFFKIVNQSVPKALERLGYSEGQVENIIDYCLGKATFNGSPHINKESLIAKGMNEEQIATVAKELGNSMDIRHQFNQWTLSEEYFNQITNNDQQDFLTALGFSEQEIEAANDYICGTMTLEGAPHLREEHYLVFDCANKCGKKGTRYIHPYGHLKMLAATQPFIAGAISKTVNMPKDWSVEQIKKAYYDAWTMMIKCVALYRDGCKLSQPLNATLEDNPMLKKLLSENPKEVTETNNQKIIVHMKKQVRIGPKKVIFTGVMDVNDSLNKVEIKMDFPTPIQKTTTQALLNSINLNLQLGVDPCLIAKNLQVEGNPLINELGNFLSEFEVSNSSEQKIEESVESNEKTELAEEGGEIKCGSCGASQLKQNGTCMLCEVCGETTGCS